MKDGRRRVRPSAVLSRVRLNEQAHPAPLQPAARHTSGTQVDWGVRRERSIGSVRRLRRHSAAVTSRSAGRRSNTRGILPARAVRAGRLGALCATTNFRDAARTDSHALAWCRQSREPCLGSNERIPEPVLRVARSVPASKLRRMHDPAGNRGGMGRNFSGEHVATDCRCRERFLHGAQSLRCYTIGRDESRTPWVWLASSSTGSTGSVISGSPGGGLPREGAPDSAAGTSPTRGQRTLRPSILVADFGSLRSSRQVG